MTAMYFFGKTASLFVEKGSYMISLYGENSKFHPGANQEARG